jgi:hypothetical protein
MTQNLNPEQFHQQSLFGENSPLNRAPDFHEMSPDAFDRHPDTMFHATFEPKLPTGRELHMGPMHVIDNKENPGRDIRGFIGQYDPKADMGPKSQKSALGSRDLNLFSAHVSPRIMSNTPQTAVSDEEGNDQKGNKYYVNDAEGPKGSLSLSINEPHPSSRPVMQSDYVQKAGRENAHPITRRAFDRGHLGTSVLPTTTLRGGGTSYDSVTKKMSRQETLLDPAGRDPNINAKAIPDAKFKKK